MNIKIKKYAELLISLSNDYLSEKTDDALFIDMVEVSVKHMKQVNKEKSVLITKEEVDLKLNNLENSYKEKYKDHFEPYSNYCTTDECQGCPKWNQDCHECNGWMH